MVCSYKEIQLSNKNKLTINTCNNIDGSENNNAEYKSPCRKCMIPFLWNHRICIQIYNIKTQISGCVQMGRCPRRGGGGDDKVSQSTFFIIILILVMASPVLFFLVQQFLCWLGSRAPLRWPLDMHIFALLSMYLIFSYPRHLNLWLKSKSGSLPVEGGKAIKNIAQVTSTCRCLRL